MCGVRARSFARFALPAVGGVTLLLGAPLASAQAWIFDPRVELDGIYNDNYRLTPDKGSEIEVTGGAVDALVTARKETPSSLFEATPHIRSSYFPDATSEDSTDYYLDLNGLHRTQRTRSRILAQFAAESVVSSELPAADFPGVDLGQVTGGDAGRVSVRNRRQLYHVEPSIEFDWTERRHLTADVHYIKAAYDNTEFEQVGYTDVGGGAGIGWDLSRRSTLSVRVLGSQFSPDDDSPDTTTEGLVAEWRTAPSAVTSFYVRLGANHSERDASGSGSDISTNSPNGGVGVAWTFQVTRIVIDALRSTSPSSQGAVVDRDELRFRLERDFSPRWTAGIALRGIRTDGVGSSTDEVRERKYYTGRASFEWRMTRQVSLEGGYEYKWQEYQGDPTSAQSNGATLSVVYQPRRLMK
ncbi:MAG: hypothetical protein WDO56_21960 [Gammaproteobacteria bacterium]